MDEQLDKVLEVRDQIPSIEKIIVFDMEGLHKLDDPMVMSFEALIEIGRKAAQTHPDLFAERVAQTQPEDIAILVLHIGHDRSAERVL